MTERGEAFFLSYNQAMEEAYNEFFRAHQKKDVLKLKEGMEKEYIHRSILNWNHNPLGELGNQTPAEYLEALDSFQEIKTLFILGAKRCDQDLPDLFLQKLQRFKEEAEEFLLGIAFNKETLLHPEEIFVSLMAIRLLGQWRVEKAIAPMVQCIYQWDESNEIIVEELGNGLVNMGEGAVDTLVKVLEDKETMGFVDEYIFSSLERIGKSSPSDLVFKCLKEVFFKMEDKVFGAMCLADYGDGRVIPALRGFFEKNRDQLNQETRNEIKAAIKKLGGSISDL